MSLHSWHFYSLILHVKRNSNKQFFFSQSSVKHDLGSHQWSTPLEENMLWLYHRQILYLRSVTWYSLGCQDNCYNWNTTVKRRLEKEKTIVFNTIIIPVYKCTSAADKHHLHHGAKCKLVEGTGGLSMIVDKVLFLCSRT